MARKRLRNNTQRAMARRARGAKKSKKKIAKMFEKKE